MLRDRKKMVPSLIYQMKFGNRKLIKIAEKALAPRFVSKNYL